jgi:hypothetical protein
MNEWKLGRRASVCGGCQRAFADGEPHFSALALADGALSRAERCSRCFGADDARSSLFWWRTRFSLATKRALVLDLEGLDALFGALEPRSEETAQELRYVLALVLLRKRRYKLARTETDASGEFLVLARPRSTASVRVRVFDLPPERQAVQKEALKRIFEGASFEHAPASARSGEHAAGAQLDCR